MKKKFIETQLIKTDGLQTRAQIDMDCVRDYATEERERGAVFPPVMVFFDGRVYWLADGFHRLAAARQNGKKKLACEVQEGGRVDALRHALTANATHGMRRTHQDKRRAILMAYEHRAELGLPDVPAANLIAELVGVSNHFTANQLGTVPSWRDAAERTGADGKSRPVNTLPPIPVRRPEVPEVEKNAFLDDLPPVPVRAVSGAVSGAGGEARLEPGVPIREAGNAVYPAVPVRSAAAGAFDVPVDEFGKPIPPELVHVWNRRGEIRELASVVSRVRVTLRNAQEGRDPLWSGTNYSSAISFLDRAYTHIKTMMPHCVCPACQGVAPDACDACRGRGLMSENLLKLMPQEMRESAKGTVTAN